uniref:Chymotrypsin inhibitor-like isoform X1 n=1 Tax=Diabrotica virgifera virgifera TaxID=50390 RepID=A0A6P7GEG5_DIAVI
MRYIAVYVTLSCLVCVVFAQDTSTTCPPNSYSACAPCCADPSCQDRNPICDKDKVCIEICKFDCRCNQGYIKDTVSGLCVRPGDCPRC